MKKLALVLETSDQSYLVKLELRTGLRWGQTEKTHYPRNSTYYVRRSWYSSSNEER